jgi:uncharacterized membrane protein
LIPTYLGIQLAVSYLLATQITSTSVNPRQQKLWKFVMIALVSSGIISCSLTSSAEGWWNKQYSSCNPQAARIINQASKPLVLSDGNGQRFDIPLANVVSLSYRLDPKVQLQLVVEPNVPKIPGGFSDVFLFAPSETLRARLEQESTGKIKPVQENKKPFRGSKVCLWKISRSS